MVAVNAQQDNRMDTLSVPQILNHADSLTPQFLQPIDSLFADSIPADTLATDTVPKKKKDMLDAPVKYESADSTIWTKGGYASLYGSGKIEYKNITLTAQVIKMQVDSSLVYADGVKDSTGNWIGAPIFTDGATPYESSHMRYNFKTEKGYINEIITQQGDGYMTSTEAKKSPDGEYFISDGIYTTCEDHLDPHFGLRITRAKVRL